MPGPRPGRTARRAPDWDPIEHKSWQHYLAAVLCMTTLLNGDLLDAHQLSLSDVQLLDLLAGSTGGSMAMRDLAEALASSPSRLTRHVRRLEERGLLVRSVDPHDRRRIVVTLTAPGRALVEAALITYADQVRTHFLGPLTRPQISAVATTCGQISDGLNRPGRTAAT